MTERQKEVVRKLLYSSSPLSLENLISTFSVSERTIKYDISAIRKEIEEIDTELLNKKGSGYYFSPDAKPKLIEYFGLYDTEETLIKDQRNLLIYTLFLESPTLLSSAANKLYFDTSTIKRYIDEIAIDQKDVSLQLKNNQFEIIGSEYEVRNFYTELIINQIMETTGSDLDVRLIEAFPNYEEEINLEWFQRVKQTTKSQLKENNIWISKDSFEYLVIYLFVLHYRNNIEENEKVKLNDSKISLKKEYRFANELLNNIFWGKFPGQETQFLIKVMLENDIFSDGQLKDTIEEELTTVINTMTNKISEFDDSLTIDEENFKKDLRPHLKQIIRKHELGITFENNPLFYQIKQKYKDHYQVAQKIYNIFCEVFEIPYSDDEASLITIYLYKNTVYKDKKIYKAYLVCGSGRGFSKLLEQRLSNIFPNIFVLETLSSFYLLKKQNINEVDLIISTIDLPKLSVPAVKVSSFLGRKDIQLINQILEYGTTTHSISLSTDITEAYETNYKVLEKINKNKTLNKEQAIIFSNIFLDFYNMLVNLPEEYLMNQDKLLGISIHLVIALPRYFDSESVVEDQNLVDEVEKIEMKNKSLSREMNIFLNKVEKEIGVGIPYSERYALYQYILN